MPSFTAALNQNWLFLVNAVGEHALSGAVFAGGSGVWAPSGIELARTSSREESILIVQGLPLKAARDTELNDFDYSRDFFKVYRKLQEDRAFTRY